MSWRRRARRHGHGSRHEKDRRKAVFLCVFLPAGAGWGVSCSGGEQVLRLRAQDGAFRAPARVTFFFCKKKVTKENHLDLRSKDPLARYGSCKIGGADLAELVRRSSLSVKRTVPAFTGAEADAAACPATVGVFASTGLAIIKSRLCRRKAAKVGVPVGHRI